MYECVLGGDRRKTRGTKECKSKDMQGSYRLRLREEKARGTNQCKLKDKQIAYLSYRER